MKKIIEKPRLVVAAAVDCEDNIGDPVAKHSKLPFGHLC